MVQCLLLPAQNPTFMSTTPLHTRSSILFKMGKLKEKENKEGGRVGEMKCHSERFFYLYQFSFLEITITLLDTPTKYFL